MKYHSTIESIRGLARSAPHYLGAHVYFSECSSPGGYLTVSVSLGNPAPDRSWLMSLSPDNEPCGTPYDDPEEVLKELTDLLTS